MATELARLFARPEEELYMELGDQLLREFGGALPTAPREREKEGRDWFGRQRAQFQDMICASDRIRAATTDQDSITLASAIIDLVALHCGIVSPATVSVIIVKLGLKSFCEKYWD